MTFISHTLVTAIGAQALHLQAWDLVLAYVFGVLIDLDHLIKLPRYFKTKRSELGMWNIFFSCLVGLSLHYQNKKFIFRRQPYHRRTSLQEPVTLFWIIPLSFFINSWIPVIFFMGHLVLDYLTTFDKLPFYPFSKFHTRGFLSKVANEIKEPVVVVASLCILFLLS